MFANRKIDEFFFGQCAYRPMPLRIKSFRPVSFVQSSDGLTSLCEDFDRKCNLFTYSVAALFISRRHFIKSSPVLVRQVVHIILPHGHRIYDFSLSDTRKLYNLVIVQSVTKFCVRSSFTTYFLIIF